MWEKIIAVGQFISPVFVFLGKTIGKSIIRVAKGYLSIVIFLAVLFCIVAITSKIFGLFNNEPIVRDDEMGDSTKEIAPVSEA